MILGVDTLVRVLNPKYYGNGTWEEMYAVMNKFKDYGIEFIVAGRKDEKTGKFATMDETLKQCIPKEDLGKLPDIFKSITELSFRVDLSSTEIRNT